jgi:hypothetical protein
MVTITKSLSGATFDATELGVVTVMASDALNFVVKMKKLSSKKATSHIAVISTEVLFLGSLGLDIIYKVFDFDNRDSQLGLFHKNKL